MAKIDSIKPEELQSICNVLGDTDNGFTGSEIGRLLSRAGIDDVSPTRTKRYRLYDALSTRQEQDGCANNVLAFIQSSMNPVRYTQDKERFEFLSGELNVALAFVGLKLTEEGKIKSQKRAATLSEAEEKARSLRQELQRRGVHPDVIKFCRAELLQRNYFHAVFEATKSVADKIRTKSGCKSDGSALVDEAFSLGKSGVPILAINSLQTESEQSEQKGFANLLKGMFGTFRNTTAHIPKVKWIIQEQDAHDLFSLASYCHRRIDVSVNVSELGK